MPLAGTLVACASPPVSDQDHTLQTTAKSVDAYDGEVVRENFAGGGLNGSRTLVVITLRPGALSEVAQAQVDDVVAAGYDALPSYQCVTEDTGGPCGFEDPTDVPAVTIESFPAGSAIRATDIDVPSGYTGILVSLRYRMSHS